MIGVEGSYGKAFVRLSAHLNLVKNATKLNCNHSDPYQKKGCSELEAE